MEKIFENIKTLVGNGETKDAIYLLVDVLKDKRSSLLDSAIIVQARVNELVLKSRIENTISNNEASIIQNQINHSILGIIENYEQKNDLEVKNRIYIRKIKNSNYLYGISFLIVCILSYFLFAIFKENKKYENELNKREEYIRILRFQDSVINQNAIILEREMPEFVGFAKEYQNLSFQHYEAVKRGDMILKGELIHRIHDLPRKYQLDSKTNKFNRVQSLIDDLSNTKMNF